MGWVCSCDPPDKISVTISTASSALACSFLICARYSSANTRALGKSQDAAVFTIRTAFLQSVLQYLPFEKPAGPAGTAQY